MCDRGWGNSFQRAHAQPIRRSAAPALQPAPVSPLGAPLVGNMLVVAVDPPATDVVVIRPMVKKVFTSHGASAAEMVRACARGERVGAL